MSAAKVKVFNPVYVQQTIEKDPASMRVTLKFVEGGKDVKSYGSVTFHPIELKDEADGKFKPLFMSWSDPSDKNSQFMTAGQMPDPSDPNAAAMLRYGKSITFNERSAKDFYRAVTAIEKRYKEIMTEYVKAGKIPDFTIDNMKFVDMIKRVNSKKTSVPVDKRGKVKENPEGRIKIELNKVHSEKHPIAPLRKQPKTTLKDFATKAAPIIDGAPLSDANIHKYLTIGSAFVGGICDITTAAINSEKYELSCMMTCSLAHVKPGQDLGFDTSDFMPEEEEQTEPAVVTPAAPAQSAQSQTQHTQGNPATPPPVDSAANTGELSIDEKINDILGEAETY